MCCVNAWRSIAVTARPSQPNLGISERTLYRKLRNLR